MAEGPDGAAVVDGVAGVREADLASRKAAAARPVRSLPLDASAKAPRGVSIAGPAVLREPVPQPKLYRPPAGSKVGSVRGRQPRSRAGRSAPYMRDPSGYGQIFTGVDSSGGATRRPGKEAPPWPRSPSASSAR